MQNRMFPLLKKYYWIALNKTAVDPHPPEACILVGKTETNYLNNFIIVLMQVMKKAKSTKKTSHQEA